MTLFYFLAAFFIINTPNVNDERKQSMSMKSVVGGYVVLAFTAWVVVGDVCRIPICTK
jgi:hypothetical protein